MKKNHLDDYFEKIINVIAKTPGSHLLYEDEETHHFFFKVLMTRMLEIRTLSFLYSTTVLTSVDSSINSTLLEFNKSKYKKQIDNTEFINEVKALKPEFIRQGYVIAFHKFEVFAKTLQDVFKEKAKKFDKYSNISFDKYSETTFDICIINHWYKFNRLHIIQFISNCTKHSDGYPISKYPKPEIFEEYPENLKIIRSTKEFKDDILYLSDLTIKYYELFNSILLHMQLEDLISDGINFNTDYEKEISLGLTTIIDNSDNNHRLIELKKRITELKSELLYSKYH
jgi:hypothetical protein